MIGAYMNLKDQRYMAALASCGSLSAAAAFLHISQPALSKWLTQLETELGVSLVIRRKKNVIFTEAGQIYLEGCQAALSAAQELLAQLKHSVKSTGIILGGSTIRGADCFASVYAPFKKEYPHIELDFYADSAPNLRKHVAGGSVTLAIIGSGTSDDTEIEYLKFLDEELLFMVPRTCSLGYPPSSDTLIPTVDFCRLGSTPLLINSIGTSYTNRIADIFERHGVSKNIIFRSDIVPILYKLVKTGVGAAFLPSAYYSENDAVSVYRYNPRPIVYQGIGIRKDRPLSSAEEYLIHLIINHWQAPFYIHQYADYYLEQRRLRLHSL